jgi:hypothetical protein
MDETTVAQWVSALGVSSDALSIGAELDDRWCLLSLADPDGSDAIVWEVFWRQQGDRFDWARFTDEQVACYYLLGRLAYGQLVLGELQTRKPAPQPDSPAQP